MLTRTERLQAVDATVQKTFHEVTPEAHRGLAETYVADPRFSLALYRKSSSST